MSVESFVVVYNSKIENLENFIGKGFRVKLDSVRKFVEYEVVLKLAEYNAKEYGKVFGEDKTPLGYCILYLASRGIYIVVFDITGRYTSEADRIIKSFCLSKDGYICQY